MILGEKSRQTLIIWIDMNSFTTLQQKPHAKKVCSIWPGKQKFLVNTLHIKPFGEIIVFFSCFCDILMMDQAVSLLIIP